MRFGTFALEEAEGALLAHTQRTSGGVIKKGTRLTAQHIDALKEAGLTFVTAAKLDDGDLHEDEAARRIAQAVAGPHTTVERADTGRANLAAASSGLIAVDAPAVDRLNAIHPSVTLATLRPFERVTAGRMIGTVKIIPFAAPAHYVAQGVEAASNSVSVAPWMVSGVSAISSQLAALKPSVIDKTLDIFAGRLEPTLARIIEDVRVPHNTEAVAQALQAAKGELVVIFGASAVVDEDDVIPAAIARAGGVVEHVGMPVDPGNLLVLGHHDGRPVIGAPGCARSPKANGFDIVLDRLLAGLTVTRADIMGMGVGGLLEETAARPRPRRGKATDRPPSKPAAIVLCAGRSTRMGARNKLLEDVGGMPMARHAVRAALASRADPVVVVTGHEADAVQRALSGLDVTFIHNAQFAEGLSTSLRAGLTALPASADAALVLLGDMPMIEAEHCNRILDGLKQPGALIAMAASEGRRGNPVAWSARLFPELLNTEGDAGGRTLMSRYADQSVTIDIGDAAAVDADTPSALSTLRERLDSSPA
ncbi:MAG: molybdopterin-binding/glycosyltransferase family 2 protein [Pseudomonadota bacterium]